MSVLVLPATLILWLLLLYVLYSALRFFISTFRPANYPPGPPIIPGLGNIHQLPRSKAFVTFSRWADQYGPIIGLKVGPANLVVIHRPEHVREAFEKRGAYYAERPKMAIPCDYVFKGEWAHHPGFMNVEFQRRQHTACKRTLGPQGLAELAPIRHAMGIQLLRSLSLLSQDDSRGFEKCFSHWALGLALATVSGQRLEDLPRNWVEHYHDVQNRLLELLEPGGVTPPIEIFPFLGWVPTCMAKWKQKASSVRQGIYDTYTAVFNHAKASLSLAPRPSRGGFDPLLVRLLRDLEPTSPITAAGNIKTPPSQPAKPRFTEREILLIGGGLLDGASHTTLGTALYLVQALAAHPTIQYRAQREIDDLFGDDALPSAATIPTSDPAALPFLSACILEVLRWRPTTPQAFPRACAADNAVVGGYTIPRGATVLINVWAIHHDPADYDNPERYDPDRWARNRLGIKDKHYPPARNTKDGDGSDRDPLAWRKPLYTFGAGRRACQGEQFAMQALRATFALLLWAYDFVAEGEMDLSVETGMHEGASVSPNPFGCRFVERKKGRLEKVREAYLATEKVLVELLP